MLKKVDWRINIRLVKVEICSEHHHHLIAKKVEEKTRKACLAQTFMHWRRKTKFTSKAAVAIEKDLKSVSSLPFFLFKHASKQDKKKAIRNIHAKFQPNQLSNSDFSLFFSLQGSKQEWEKESYLENPCQSGLEMTILAHST